MLVGFRKEDVKILYDAFVKLCDYIECEIECSKCPMWKNICGKSDSVEYNDFAESLKRIRDNF